MRLPILLFAAAAIHAATPPNIVYILADDLAQGDLGCYGQKLIKTPRIDRMAREGTRFTQLYCGTAVSAPSRASLMTGLHSGHCPVRGNWEIAAGAGQRPLPAGTVTVAQVLKNAGYATACMGKWGMGMFDTSGSPLKMGFDHFFGYNCQRHAHSYFPTHLFRDDQRFDLPGNTGKGVGKTYAQNLIQDDVLAWVKANHARPFFLFYAITLPHGEHEIDEVGEYRDRDWSDLEKNYAAQVTRLDRDVGQLLDLLAELKVDDNTIVFLSGDNGSSFGPETPLGRRFDQAANGLRGFKRGLYEGALRQAGVVRWPGKVPAGTVSDTPWAFWDVLPTAAAIAGAKLPDGFVPDGLDVSPLLTAGAAPKREVFYWELHEGKPIQAVRFGNWKAVRNGPAKPIELYDLAVDPGERNNLATGKPDLVAKADALMKEHHRDDPAWPLDGPAPERVKKKR